MFPQHRTATSWLLITACIFCSLSYAKTAYSEESSSRDKPIEIGVEAMNYCPILCFEETQVSGFIFDLLKTLEAETGREYRITPFAIARLNKVLMEGQVDVIFPDNPAWSVGEAEQFSVPIIAYRDAFFSLEKIEANKGINTAAIPPGFYVPKNIRNNIKVIEATSIQAMFSMLQNGRVDAIYLNHLVAQNQANRFGLNIVERSDYPSDKSHFHFRSVNSPLFLSHINQFIAEQPQILRSLLDKYELH